MLEIIFLEGRRQGETIRLNFEKAWFGRQPSCDVVLHGEGTDGTHFVIMRQGADYVLVNNESLNATFVNGLPATTVTLQAGDKIVAGANVMQVREVTVDPHLAFRFVAEHQGQAAGPQIIELASILLGRKSICQVQLNDPNISPVHAELDRRPDGVWIIDRSLGAGVYVNGQRVVEQQLRDGDLITIRPFEITIGLKEQICALGIRECAPATPGATAQDLPKNYRDVIERPPVPQAPHEQPSADIVGLPHWIQPKAPIWVPTSDILPNRFRFGMLLAALLAVLAFAAFALVSRRHSLYIPGPTAAFHSAVNSDFRCKLAASETSSDCAACHTGFRRDQTANCQSCHEEIGLPEIPAHQCFKVACAKCHSEHMGAQFDVARNVGGGCQSAGCHVTVHQKQKQILASQGLPAADAATPRAVAFEARFDDKEDEIHQKHLNSSRLAHLDKQAKCGACHNMEEGRKAKDTPKDVMRMRCLVCHGFGPEATLRARCYSCHFEHKTDPKKALIATKFSDSPVAAASVAGNDYSGILLALGAIAGIPLFYFAAVAGRFRFEIGALRTQTDKSIQIAPAAPVCEPAALVPAPPAVVPVLPEPKPTDNQAPGGCPRPQIDLDRCLGCGSCVLACPYDVLEVVNEKAIAVHLGDCMGDTSCAEECPTNAILLVTGGAMQTEELPVYDANLESNIPGLYLAGEITGKALIKIAINQGKKVVDSIVTQHPQLGKQYDLIVVGAGPAGTSAALAAKKERMNVLVLEQGTTANTIRTYSRQKFVMADPVSIPLYGLLWMEPTSKEALLERWQQIIASTGLVIHEEEKVLRVVRRTDDFLVQSTKGEYQGTRVVLAVGRRGSPRKLGVLGEDTSKVTYNLQNADAYREKAICVVGGGDSGIEVANGLARADLKNRVWLVHLKADFSRANSRNRKRIQKSIDKGRLKVFFKSSVVEIRDRSVLVKTSTGVEEIENDFVFVMIGGENPKDFLTGCGIEFSNRAPG